MTQFEPADFPRGRGTVDLCFNCESQADTRDHVPPKGLFTTPAPPTLITVPACKSCNKSTEKDDEYFRCIIAAGGEDTPAAAALREQRILPQFQRRPALGHAIMSRSRAVEVVSPAGILLGRRPAFEFEYDRFHRVIAKIVKGLYLHEYGERMVGAIVDDFVLNPELSEDQRAYFSRLRLNIVAPGIFSYRCERAALDPLSSGWLLMFFDQTLVATQTRRIEQAPGHEARRAHEADPW